MPCYDLTAFLYKASSFTMKVATLALYLTGNKRIARSAKFLRKLSPK